MTERPNNQRKHIILLSALAVGMVGFSFALVPLYAIFCEVVGLNGKKYEQEISAEPAVLQVSEREVTIQFLAQVGRGMPWEFRPTDSRLKVRLGEVHTTSYYARNRADQAVTGQAVPSVSPAYASNFLHKLECFCFTQQHLDAGEQQQMALRFYIDAELPEDINMLTLSYSLFQVPDADVEVASLALAGN